jgi:MFS family permease
LPGSSSAIPASSIVGGPLSGALLQMHGSSGLSGWRWMFLLEGLPVAALGIALLFVLADRPDTAAWLTEDERKIGTTVWPPSIARNEVRRMGAALKDVRVLLLAGLQFVFLVGSSASRSGCRRSSRPATSRISRSASSPAPASSSPRWSC